jgi:hypothetical protein
MEDSETPETPEITTGGTEVTIPPDPPPEEKADAGDAAAQRQTRAERRNEFAAQKREAEERSTRLENELRTSREEMATLRGRIEAGESWRTSQQVDPNVQALDDMAEKMEAVVARMGAGDPSAVKEWHSLRREEARLIAKVEAGESAKGVEERVKRDMPTPQDPRLSAIAAEFPFLGDDAGARAVAEGHVARLVAVERRDMKNPSVRYATLREGAALAARDLGLPGAKTEPTRQDRDRIAGVRGGDSGAGNGGVTKVHLSKDQMKLAETLFRQLPAEEAHVKWWKTIGVKAQRG